MAVTTTTQVDPEVSLYFDNILLDREQPFYVHSFFAQERRIPQKNSKTAIFRRYDNLSDALTPLSEGITPASEQVSKFDITAVVSQFGKVVELTDDIIVTVQDQTSNEIADMLAQNSYSTYDVLIRNMLIATASQIDAINGVNGNAQTEITSTDVERALDYLYGNNAKRMAPNQEGTNAFGTAPVWASYWGILHSDIRSDLKALSNFLPTAGYPRQQSVLQAEYGSTDEVRWVFSTQAAKSTANPAVYSLFITGANSYGRISIDEQSMEMIIKPLGAGEDSLNQRSTMGWKGRLGSVILDDSWIVNLRVTKA